MLLLHSGDYGMCSCVLSAGRAVHAVICNIVEAKYSIVVCWFFFFKQKTAYEI